MFFKPFTLGKLVFPMIPLTALEKKNRKGTKRNFPLFVVFKLCWKQKYFFLINFSIKVVWKTKLIENFQPANDFAPSFVSSIVKNGEIILVLDLSFPVLLTAIYSWGKTHLFLSHTKSAVMLLEYKTRFGPLYSMSFCFLIETYNKGSFMINMHCT